MTDAALHMPEWDAMLANIAPVGDQLLNCWGRTDPSADDRRDLFRLVLSAVANGYLSHVALDPARPTWVPCWNISMNMGGPCPDYTYRTTDVDPAGTYRIPGFRGTNRFVEIGQQSYELLGHEGPTSVAPMQHSLDELALGRDGAFSVILSAERPAGHEGDWWPLQPRTVRLLLRQCAVDWINEVEPRAEPLNRRDRRDRRPMLPGGRSGRAVRRKAWRPRVNNHSARSRRYENAARNMPCLNRRRS